MRWLPHIFLVLTLVSLPLSAQDGLIIQVNARLSETSITQEDVVVLGVVISGNTLINEADVRLPNLPEFRIVSQSTRTNTQNINGKVASALQYLYYLVPKSTGTLAIPAIEVVYKGDSYFTEPLSLQVTEATGTSNLITRLVADKQSVYVGQQVTFETQLMFNTSIQVSQYDMTQAPGIEGFIIIPDPTLKRQERSFAELDSERYVVFTLSRSILFPLSSGTKTVEGVPFEIQYYESRFGNNIKYAERQTNDLVIEVLPLPEGAPDSFTGAVGDFDISWSIDRTEGKAEEPFTLVIEIRGTGDIERLPDPELDFGERVEIIPVKNSFDTAVRNGLWGGRKRLEYILVPGEAGEQEIGPLEYSFFNPSTKEYEITSTESFALSIEEAERQQQQFAAPQVRPEGREEDIRYIREQPAGSPVSPMPSLPVILLVLAVPLLINSGAWLFRGINSMTRSAEPGNKKKKALRNALNRLGALPAAGREANQTELDRIASAVRGYFSDRFKLPRLVAQSEIREALKRHDLHESEEMNTIARLLDHCSAGKYAPSAMKGQPLETLLNSARSALLGIEEKL